MGLLERIADRRRSQPQAAWPVGEGSVLPGDREWGHDDSRFSPEEYGDYLATSNDVFSAAMLRARLMASLQLRLYDQDGPEKAEVTAGPEWELLRHVNPFWTRRRLAMMDELAMCLWGESYWAIEHIAGRPAEIWWLKPSQVRPVPHETKYLAGWLYEPQMGGPLIPFRPDEIVWFRYANPIDEFSALSPLAAARLAADTSSAMMKSNRNLFDKGIQLAGIVTPSTGKVSFGDTQAKDLEQALDRRFTGADKAHKWAVLRYEAQFQQITMSPKDAEFIQGLNITLRQVCNAFGVPAPLLNEMSSATLSNAREYERLLWTHALVPDARLRTEEIVEQFLPKFRASRVGHVEHDFSTVAALQESEGEQWSREAQAIERGAITINEWRKKHGMPPVPWGDVFWAPVNKSPVTGADDNPAGGSADDGSGGGDLVPAQDAAALLHGLDYWQTRAAFNLMPRP